MKWKINQRTRLSLSGVIVLLIGLGTSALVYLTAENVAVDALSGYENSKRYMHDLELYGGKMNVLAVELDKWFSGLWHGKALAYTIAGITLCIAAVLFFVAEHQPSDPGSTGRDENERDTSDGKI